MSQEQIDQAIAKDYAAGFTTDIESDTLSPGLTEDTIRFISAKKNEPEWLLEWRLGAFQVWCEMAGPDWAHVDYPDVDFQSISYYSQPKSMEDRPKSLDEVDPELLATYEKLAESGVLFCSISEAVQQYPDLVRKHLGSVVPRKDNFYAALNSAVFSDGSFVYIPKGVRCPMELSTYFRINEANTGQFERTLIIADEGSHVSYLEGCTAPMRDENQLHAAVVELVALDDAEIKYSTVQNWYPGDAEGKGGIYNFVTKRGLAHANAKISWTQVETGSAVTWKYPSCILRGDNS
ncbi:MAG: SufD family Fe-S cluster assembly protein, partial [Gammaproteobacteria bacterium]|nr:SufD family Fe-S cluster assembly protein [Gammaproteobacteria bacterium]